MRTNYGIGSCPGLFRVIISGHRRAGWRWVNLWATWCTPCVEEMALLRQWRDGFARDGAPVAFDVQASAEGDVARVDRREPVAYT